MTNNLRLPLIIRWAGAGCEQALSGATWPDIARFYPRDPIRQLERASIRAFMEKHRALLRGRVLDFGAGTEPYRDLVEGEYVPAEKGDRLSGSFDAIMCNQVMQYIPYPETLLAQFRQWLNPGGHLVMTFPTNWDEVESEDLWRFTAAGMRGALEQIGFRIVELALRAAVELGSFKFPLGYGVVCTVA